MMRTLRKLWKRFEAAMAAVAFAEEGEIETARQIMAEAREGEADERVYRMQTGRTLKWRI